MQLVSNFGALRDDHFHMGLDLRTGGKENLPVYAAAGGYISRIKIEKYGFGNAIYISHPNGYTTLYAHLNTFYGALAAYIKKKQYEDESWAQDVELPAGLFSVAKGQLIGLSGNTGGSAGPHLHFEIRDSKTGANINPEFFGFAITDKIAPAIKGLYWYDRRYSTYAVAANAVALKRKNVTVIVNSPSISFGIDADDMNNGSSFHLGIYSAVLYMDDSLLYESEINRINYDDTRYINACIDYSKRARDKKFVQHLSVLPGNQLDIFSDAESDGVIMLNDTLPHKIRIETEDIYNNRSALNFSVKYSGSNAHVVVPPYRQLLIPQQENVLQSEHIQLKFPATAFYDTVPFRFNEFVSKADNAASGIYVLHNAEVPVHDAYSATVQTTLDAQNELRNHVIMKLQSGSSTKIIKGAWSGNSMTGECKKLGTLQLVIDTVPPVIAAAGFANNAVITAKKLAIKCTDDLKEIASFRAELDGQWLLFVASKNDLYTYTFDEHCSKGKHTLKIIATDIAGNIAEQNFNFTR